MFGNGTHHRGGGKTQHHLLSPGRRGCVYLVDVAVGAAADALDELEVLLGVAPGQVAHPPATSTAAHSAGGGPDRPRPPRPGRMKERVREPNTGVLTACPLPTPATWRRAAVPRRRNGRRPAHLPRGGT